MLWVLALTSIHPGVGRSEEAQVDLPVQRDEFGLPAIWASSLKGAARAKAERGLFNGDKCVGKVGDCAEVLALFGPKPEDAHEHSSAVAFLDAKLFAIPARSLKGVWLYVTSPLLVSFARLYAEALGVSLSLPDPPRVQPGEVALSDPSYAQGNVVVINEISFKLANTSAPTYNIQPVNKVGQITGRNPAFAVVSDDDMPRVVRRSLLVQYRVRLDRERKTVDVGPWSEEYMPPFTIFVSGIHCHGRMPQKVKVKVSDPQQPGAYKIQDEAVQIKDLCDRAYSLVAGPLWIGGKETVGKGLVEVV